MPAARFPLTPLLARPGGLPSAGSPLPSSVRTAHEHHTGVDLSPVRVHGMPPAIRSSRGDKAFAIGSDIVLGSDPSAPAAQKTLAHEIAHVVQHGGGSGGLTDLSRSNDVVQGQDGLSERDRELIRDWLASGRQDQGQGWGQGGGPNGLTLTFPIPGQSQPSTSLSRTTICNTNCHQTPDEQRQEAARRAEEARQSALRRAWPGAVRSQSTDELSKQGTTIAQDIEASRLAEGQLRVRMFDAAMASGRRGVPGAGQIDERIRDAWVAAELAAGMVDAVFRASGTEPVPNVVIDPLRPWFVAFYASVSRLFRDLDVNERMFALAFNSGASPTGPTRQTTVCPGGCHQPNPQAGPNLGGFPDLAPRQAAPATTRPAVLDDLTPGPREARLLQAATSVQEANSKESWTTATGHFAWATEQLDTELRRRVRAAGDQSELLEGMTSAQELRKRQEQFLLTYPTALKVPAVFFPRDDVSEQQYDATGKARPVAKAIPWNLYLVRTPVTDSNYVPTGFEWSLHDLTATKGPDRTIRTRHQVTAFEGLARERLGGADVLNIDPPRSMFEQLNHRDFFPEGQLSFRWPISHRDDSIETTSPKPFWEWVALFGIAISVAGSIVFAPFSTPALIAFAAGTGLTLGARYMRLEEMREHGVWTQADSNRFAWEMAQDLLAALTLGVGRFAIIAAEAGQVARAASAARVWFNLRRVEFGTHVVNVGVTTEDLVTKFREIEKSKMTPAQKEAAYRSLAFQAVLAGTLSAVAFRGSGNLLSGRPVLHLTPDLARPGRFVATLSTTRMTDVLSETAGLSSARLRQKPKTLEEEFQLTKSMPQRRLEDETYDLEVLLTNGHAWRRQRGTKRWCRFSDDPLCFVFGEGGGHNIEVFPAERKARQGFWSGTPGNSEFTPNSADVLRRTGFQPIVYINGYPDLRPFAVGQALLPRALLAQRNRDAHNAFADAAYARQRGWLTPAGTPDADRVAVLRGNLADPLTWHHVEFDNVMLLIPRLIHQAAQHAGGYARQ